ncbi:UNVERIFIED_CONTAM: hypothetical protein PYX00_009625 [Menopon gallinae]|uniref:Cation-transporting ATPase n=1 Tax=Menopon gallinae TaxID=328185 RepID=A0AAW2HC88_9NEOP
MTLGIIMLSEWFSRAREGYEEITEETCSQILTSNQDDNDKLLITGFRANKLRKWLFYVVTILLCGVPFLLTRWYPQLRVWKYSKSSFRDADFVLVRDSYDVYSVHTIRRVAFSSDSSFSFRKSLASIVNIGGQTKYFNHKDIKYVWCNESQQFYQLRGWDNGVKSVKELLEDSVGYSPDEQRQVLQLYGRNEIKIVVKSYWRLLLSEIVNPFYLFQLFSVVVWSVDEYVYYAICVIVTTVFTICITLYSAKQQLQSLQNLVKKSAVNKVRVVRKDGTVEELDSWMLVPGDVIEIPVNGCVMACDALILNGNCIVNESTLTGESAPVTKTPPPCTGDAFDSAILKRHTLFCGTEIVQTRYYGGNMVRAVTINTGFSTAKGELVRSILHPKPIGFKFDKDSLKFTCCLFLLATLGILYLLWVCISREWDLRSYILTSLDLITIVVPPALPAAMTAGIVYARSRLLTKGIYCICPPKINFCGKIKLFCFDKTGTLTEGGLKLWGVVPSLTDKFGEVTKDPTKMDPTDSLVVAMATCHSLTRIAGKLSGDPLDLSIFNSIDWDLEEPGNDVNRYDLLCPTIVKPKSVGQQLLDRSKSVSLDLVPRTAEASPIKNKHSSEPYMNQLPYEIGIVREFPFTSASQCMSVITRRLGEDHMKLFCKGAPDKIRDLCEPNSLPVNFNSELQTYTSAGYRVLGVAYKDFDHKFNWRKSQRVKREDVECGLHFLGLLVMQNTLKKMTTPVIKELKAADIRCVMITGDNLLTAVSVSRECQMVKPEDAVIEVSVKQTDDPSKAPVLTFDPIDSANNNNKNRGDRREDLPYPGVTCPRYHYAIDGKTWSLLRSHFPELVPHITVRSTIFARMLPEQKTQVVEAFQDLDYIVGMCGDGANDCGAMKAAHIGVSLSEAESSVAAPFTSKVPDISCILSLVKEGRCALISSFVIFKYMAMYSLIQFISVLILYTNDISLSNMEFLYIDLVITTSLAVVIGRTGPANTLVKTRPIARLVSPANVIPLLLQIIFTFFIQLSSLQYLYLQDWFEPTTSQDVTTSWENTVVYCVSSFQYLILALVYSKGKPYRQSFYRDIPFMAVFVSLLAFTTLLCVYPVNPVGSFFELMPVADDTPKQAIFRFELLIFPLGNLIISFLIEVSVTNRKWLKKFIHFSLRKRKPKNKYKQILLESSRHDFMYEKISLNV